MSTPHGREYYDARQDIANTVKLSSLSLWQATQVKFHHTVVPPAKLMVVYLDFRDDKPVCIAIIIIIHVHV